MLKGGLEGDTLQTSLNKLAGHRILAAPIKTPSGGYVMIDAANIAASLAQNPENKNLPILSIIGQVTREKCYAIDIDASLKDLVNLLNKECLHRVLVLKLGHPHNVVSQMDLIKFLSVHADLIPSAMLKINIGDVMAQNPLVIDKNEKVRDAVLKCVKDSLSGAAIVNDEGTVVANFSMADLRGAATEKMEVLLTMTVEKYLEETKKYSKLPITMKAEDSLVEAMRNMHRHHIHRIHVVDIKEHPVGLVSSTDIIRVLRSILESDIAKIPLKV